MRSAPRTGPTDRPLSLGSPVQIDKNVEREILNHRMLNNAHVIGFREVWREGAAVDQGVSWLDYVA
jgi:hypothetical protein